MAEGSAVGGLLVDAHHHVWDPSRRPQPWLEAPGLAPLRRRFGTDDLRLTATRTVAGRTLGASVVVQCLPSAAETEELLALAATDSLVVAVTGWVDLTAPGAGDEVDRLGSLPGGAALRSVRHLVQDESDPAWLQRPEVERGLRAVADRGLGYDVLVRAHQLPAATALAERVPELRLALDHAGKPPVAGGDLRDWSACLGELASHPQVVCKLSGLVTEADHGRWTAADLVPVVDALLAAFGPDRLMFGSDWPVCVLAGGWDAWAGAAEELLAGLSAAELHSVLAGAASTFYGLDARVVRPGVGARPVEVAR